MERIENFDKNPFLTGPAEFLAGSIADAIRCVPQFKLIFGEFIDGYLKMDYSERSLPALRIFNENYTKESEDWFIDGEIKVDVIFPANIRRDETQRLQDTIASALLQQFRRTKFFIDVSASVPGLNELGRRFVVEKGLGFEWKDGVVPLTRITLNFRIDLRQWDLYLEQNGRTTDDPFEVTLADLKTIATTIQALRDDGTVDTSITFQQK